MTYTGHKRGSGLLMRVISVLPSYHFPNAIVIKTKCGHNHVRPDTMEIKVGDNFECYCERKEKVNEN